MLEEFFGAVLSPIITLEDGHRVAAEELVVDPERERRAVVLVLGAPRKLDCLAHHHHLVVHLNLASR